MPQDGGTAQNQWELNRADLLRLLSYLEGELQARDVVIAALKAEKSKQLVNQARYGRLSFTDPFSALQRDCELTNGDQDEFDEVATGRLYENQLCYLERLVTAQRGTHLRARQVLGIVEEHHRRMIEELEGDRIRRAEDETKRGASVYALLEREREHLKALDRQLCQYRKVKVELELTKQALEKEKQRHKAIILYLLGEYERLQERREHQKVFSPGTLSKCSSRDSSESGDEANDRWWRHRSPNGHLENEELGGIRKGTDELSTRETPSTALSTVTISVLVHLSHQEETLNVDGSIRRRGSSSVGQNRVGVWAATKNYISNAAKMGMGRRPVFLSSPLVKRRGQGGECTEDGRQPKRKTSGDDTDSPITQEDGNQSKVATVDEDQVDQDGAKDAEQNDGFLRRWSSKYRSCSEGWLMAPGSSSTEGTSSTSVERRARWLRALPSLVTRTPATQSDSSSMGLAYLSNKLRAFSSESLVSERKSTPQVLGYTSPYLALRRKAKALGGFANRIQQRLVSGVVSQVATRHRPAVHHGSREQLKSW